MRGAARDRHIVGVPDRDRDHAPQGGGDVRHRQRRRTRVPPRLLGRVRDVHEAAAHAGPAAQRMHQRIEDVVADGRAGGLRHLGGDALGAAIRATRPALVVCVGQAGGRERISIERVAINVDDARIADNTGARPVDRPIVARGPAAYFSTLPVKRLCRDLQHAGVPAEVSQTAGTMLKFAAIGVISVPQ